MCSLAPESDPAHCRSVDAQEHKPALQLGFGLWGCEFDARFRVAGFVLGLRLASAALG